MIAIDTETTGTDLKHGALPYFVTTCDEKDEQKYWEWDVDPETREPQIPEEDLKEIEDEVDETNLVLHNSVFDVIALENIGINLDWDFIDDTLAVSHLLSTNTPHTLTWITKHYLGVNVQPFEDKVKTCVNHARDLCKRNLDWSIAGPGLEDMPSVKSSSDTSRGTEGESYWKADMWLPRMLAKLEPDLIPEISPSRKNVPSRTYKNIKTGRAWKASKHPIEDHEWMHCLEQYANSDTWATINIWKVTKELMKKRSLMKIYEERKRILPIVHRMQNDGITLSRSRLNKLRKDYTSIVSSSENRLKEIAQEFDYELDVPKGANNDSIKKFCFGHTPEFKGDGKTGCKICGKARPKTERGVIGWRQRIGQSTLKASLDLYCSESCYGKRKVGKWLDLPVVALTEKGAPTTNKLAIGIYKQTLEPGTPQRDFIDNLSQKRKLGKSLEYMDSYEKFWHPCRNKGRRIKDQFRLHPNLNPFGTDTLRWSSHNPSQQVISKQKDHNGRNLRYIFGPAEGRVWYSLDYDNLELRIPAYECREPAMLELFEHPDQAPYFGSYHLLIFSILHPDLYDHKDPLGLLKAKDKYPEWYSKTKNGNFAELYGAVDTGDGKGTADRAFGIPGAQAIIASRLTEKNKLNQKYIEIASRQGYVETIPDKSIDPDRGYPIRCKTNLWNKVVTTTPLNYHVQGTACWVMMRAMIKVQELLDGWGTDYKMVMNIHDEIVLDFPKRFAKSGKDLNLPKTLSVRRAMENIGDDINVRLTCGLDRHENSWLNSVSL